MRPTHAASRPRVMTDELFRRGGLRTVVQGPVYFQTILFFFFFLQNPSLQIPRVKGDGFQTEIREEGEAENREREQSSTKGTGRRGDGEGTPRRGKAAAGPAPEETAPSEGRRGGRAQGGGRSRK